MNLCLYAALVLCFFAILLASGARLFGAFLGGPMRGAAIPLLAIPLASDWLRVLFRVSPAIAFAVSLALYLAFGSGFFLWVKPKGPFSSNLAGRRIWFLSLAIFLAIHVVLRTWLFTGSLQNPADDGGWGAKALSLMYSNSWPTMHWEARGLPISYYYYAYEWPAAFASLARVPLLAGSWATAVVLCVMGAMLILEVILPRLRSRRDWILGSLVVLNGCTLSFLLGVAQKLPPRQWTQEQDVISKHFGLFLHVPQFTGAYWDPHVPFITGVLIVALVFFWRWIAERRLGRPEACFIILALASLAGYCSFYLLGFVLAVLPVVVVAAIVIQRGEVWRRFFKPLIPMGVASLLLCLPIVIQLLHRVPGARVARFRDPLLVWLPGAPGRVGLGVIAGLALLAIFSTAISNLLVLPVLFRGSREPLPAYTKYLLGIFILGSFVCFFGVADDFVNKFGAFVAATAILAFFTLEKPPKWSVPLMVCGVIFPCFIMLDIVHANLTKPKMDPIWRTLDKIHDQTHEVVLYDVPLSVLKQRIPWDNLAPYWSRIQFLVPAEDFDEIARLYLTDPSQISSLPPTEVRLRAVANGSPTYLLLRTADAPIAGERLYTSALFSLDRVKLQ